MAIVDICMVVSGSIVLFSPTRPGDRHSNSTSAKQACSSMCSRLPCVSYIRVQAGLQTATAVVSMPRVG